MYLHIFATISTSGSKNQIFIVSSDIKEKSNQKMLQAEGARKIFAFFISVSSRIRVAQNTVQNPVSVFLEPFSLNKNVQILHKKCKIDKCTDIRGFGVVSVIIFSNHIRYPSISADIRYPCAWFLAPDRFFWKSRHF